MRGVIVVNILVVISNMMIPIIIAAIVVYGWLCKVPLFTSFCKGAVDGFKVVIRIMPTIVGLMVAIGILRASGALELITLAAKPLADALSFPFQAVPLIFMRLVSASGSTGLILDIFKTYGPDSFLGRFVSVLMSCTETVFYTMGVYFASVKITKTRYTLAGALIANFAGVVASFIIVRMVFV